MATMTTTPGTYVLEKETDLAHPNAMIRALRVLSDEGTQAEMSQENT